MSSIYYRNINSHNEQKVTKDQDQYFIFVLEALRDQDLGIEDYITAKMSTISVYIPLIYILMVM